jgi:hypothetical protein
MGVTVTLEWLYDFDEGAGLRSRSLRLTNTLADLSDVQLHGYLGRIARETANSEPRSIVWPIRATISTPT